MKFTSLENHLTHHLFNISEIKLAINLLEENEHTVFDLYMNDNEKRKSFHLALYTTLIQNCENKYKDILKQLWNYEKGKYQKALYEVTNNTKFGKELIKSSNNIIYDYKLIEEKSDLEGLKNIVTKNPSLKEKIPKIYKNNDIEFLFSCENLGINVDNKIKFEELVNDKNATHNPHILLAFLQRHKENIPSKKWNNLIKEFMNYTTELSFSSAKKSLGAKYIADGMFLMRELKDKDKVSSNDLWLDEATFCLENAIDNLNKNKTQIEKREVVFLYADIKDTIENKNNMKENLCVRFSHEMAQINLKNYFISDTMKQLKFLTKELKIQIIDQNWDTFFAPHKKGYVFERRYGNSNNLKLLTQFFKEEETQEYFVHKFMQCNIKSICNEITFFEAINYIKSHPKFDIQNNLPTELKEKIEKKAVELIINYPEKENLIKYEFQIDDRKLERLKPLIMSLKLEKSLDEKPYIPKLKL